MKASVALHVREDEERVLVTPIPFVDLALDAPTLARATALLLPSLEDRIATLEPIDRLPFFAAPDASVHRAVVSFPVAETDGASFEIAIGIVVVRRVVRGRTLMVGYAPAIPGLQLAAADGAVGGLVARVAEASRGRMRSWLPEYVLNADEPESSRIQILEVEVDEPEVDGPRGSDRVRTSRTRAQEILDELGVDLSRREDGRIDGREELVQRVLETLGAPGRSSVLLVGPPDVGKSALVHEIARRVATGACPESLRGRRVFRLSANELIAGAQYIGQWQDRARQLVQAASSGAVVAMGDPMGVIDAGRWSKSDSGLARYLRPYVESGEITLICESTPDQLSAAQRQEPSFVAVFHRVDVEEPGPEAVGPIVAAAAAHLGASAGVAVDAAGVDASVELTRRFEPYRGFPGKAVRLVEDAVRERPEGASSLGRAEVTAAFARRSGLPLALLSDDVQFRMAEVREHFEQRVLGQPRATSTVADLVAVLKAGLSDPSKPLASYFFVGPTGVGKTELAKALAEFLFGSRERLVRFDMAEYASPDAVQRLVGTSWGSSEGELTRRVREQPFCVVLLDEIEKAHPSVFDALLAVIGEGRLTDAAGRVADFRSAIVIMTSNLGASRSRSAALGFGGDSGVTGDRYVEEAERFFRPEFFNRIDRVVVFHPLAAATVERSPGSS